MSDDYAVGVAEDGLPYIRLKTNGEVIAERDAALARVAALEEALRGYNDIANRAWGAYLADGLDARSALLKNAIGDLEGHRTDCDALLAEKGTGDG